MSAATAAPRPHDPLDNREQQKGFCARLRDFGYDYAAVAVALERIGLPRPSGGTGAYRALLVTAARSRPRDDTHELADVVAQLYRPALHLWLPPEPDADGYLAALLDAPASCAAAPQWRDITICDGGAAIQPEDCRWPDITGAAPCSDPEAA